ncbi:Small-conductance mechanosensitive channel MscMJ [Candidatus Methanobinarius endosymbioticus]|uniref:Small-conductance mechanosensitive channel MscMJ n=1 Tax=Candidatus Methanobinarius endosymbioticus TaxID=2006182 RepID=A0A366MBW1_9EURY|nr:Small-conductance mechanosensitive channel MscMJ [Candidatus Methanobinarius endosymbioticus]
MNIFNVPQYPFLEFLLYTVIVLIVSTVLVRILAFIINKLAKKFNIELTLNYLFKDLAKYVIYIFAFVIILGMAGVDINALIVSLGVVGVTLGFAAKDIISSFVSGIFLLADKTVKVGEVIEVEDIKGEVKKLGFRTTTLVTSDNLIVTVPNTVLSQNPYTNYTYFDKHRIDLEVILPLNVDIADFEKSLVKRISDLPWILENSNPQINVIEMNEEGSKLKISACSDEYSKIETCRLDLANEVRKLIGEM